jgi:acetyltransferase-like isoleucine patch superfamily enzyme/acyl carrier protein
MITKESVVSEKRVTLPFDLLLEVRQAFPELQAQDAFVVPTWFYRQKSWIEDSWHSENVVYNYPVALRLTGPLDHEILRQSLDDVQRRHHVLRSVLRIMNSRLVQIIVPSVPLDLPVVDLTGRGESERDARLLQLMLEEVQRPFELTSQALFKATLIRLSPIDHVLLLNTHNLVCDDWSTGIMIRELFTLYDSLARKANECMPELSFSYGDFIRWQERLPSNAARQLSYKAKLSGCKGFYHLRTDFPRAARRHCNGATVRFFLPQDLEKNLRLLGQRHQITVFMALLAGFHCLLHTYSGDVDVGVGTCAANRPLPAAEALIGRFGNDLLVRADLSGNPNFREVLVRVRDAVLEGQDYRDLPFGAVLEELIPVPNPNATPLFQAMFILQNAPREKPKAGELSIHRMYFDAQMAKYDLTVWLKMEEELEIAFEYNRDLFRQESIRNMAKDYEAILTTMAGDTNKRLSDLNTASSPTERSNNHCRATAAAKDSDARFPIVDSGDDLVPELLMIWKEILGLEKIGVKEDFFQLGGDSLRATQLLTRIDNQFGKNLSLGLLLRARTVQAQALAIKQQEALRNEGGGGEREALPQAPPVVPATGHENADSLQSWDALGSTTTNKSIVRRGLNRILHILCRLLPGATTLRPFLHRMRGVRIGKHVWIGDDVYLENEYPEHVEIQDGVNIGLRTTILAHTHGTGKIVIGKNAFIGTGSIIVTAANTLVVGEGSVVMASSLVTSNVAPYTLYGPAGAKPLAKVRRPFTENTSYEEFVKTLCPL